MSTLHEFKLRLSNDAWTAILVVMTALMGLVSVTSPGVTPLASVITVGLAAMAVALLHHLDGYSEQCFCSAMVMIAVVSACLSVCVTTVRVLPIDSIAIKLFIICVVTISIATAYHKHYARVTDQHTAMASQRY